MSIALKLKGGRKEWRISTVGTGTSHSICLNWPLKEHINLTFTDYCSTRTKKKLSKVQRAGIQKCPVLSSNSPV